MADPAKDCAQVIGSGPNGLAAAILLARGGYRVTVHEAAEQIGGGARSAGLTLPGFVHDVCSTVLPVAACSPCFEQFPLADYGLEWVHPSAPLAHPLDDGSAVVLHRALQATCQGLEADGAAWHSLYAPLATNWSELRHDVLAPIRVPRHPIALACFGLHALRSARGLAESRFRDVRARALFAGLAAHSVLPLEQSASAAVALVLGACAHTTGWPFPRGGAQRLSDALAGYLRSLGGEIRTGSRITGLPEGGIVMCDIGPRQLAAIGGSRFPAWFRAALARFRYGAGVFKADWALDGPIPWRARECALAGTVHVGGTLEEIARWESEHRGPPFVLLAQTSLFDATRAPQSKHTVWAYCHVPSGSTQDMTSAIEDQIERFAPGFRARVLARHTMTAAALEEYNPNLVGGDISGGEMNLQQVFLRPTPLLYRTPAAGVFLCSASTPPGGGVHGMCGYHAVRAAI